MEVIVLSWKKVHRKFLCFVSFLQGKKVGNPAATQIHPSPSCQSYHLQLTVGPLTSQRSRSRLARNWIRTLDLGLSEALQRSFPTDKLPVIIAIIKPGQGPGGSGMSQAEEWARWAWSNYIICIYEILKRLIKLFYFFKGPLSKSPPPELSRRRGVWLQSPGEADPAVITYWENFRCPPRQLRTQYLPLCLWPPSKVVILYQFYLHERELEIRDVAKQTLRLTCVWEFPI